MIAAERAETILALTRDARLSPFALSAIPARRVVAASVSRNVERTLRSRITMWTKLRALFPDLAPQRTVNDSRSKSRQPMAVLSVGRATG